MNYSKKYVLIFSGFNQRAVISFLRTLKKNKVKYAIIAKSKSDDIFLTEYKDKVLAIRNLVSLVLEDLLDSIKKVKQQCNADEYIIAPSTEALNRLLIENKNVFEEIGCIVPLVNKNLYELISNKYSFGKLCSKNGITVPKEIEFRKKLVKKIVAKPKKYFSSYSEKTLSPVIINKSSGSEMFLKNYNIKDFYYQEYIEGESIYLLYYFDKNGYIYKFSQKNLIQQPGGKSMVASISADFHNTQESYKYEKLFKKLKFHGFVMIEVKHNKSYNYMIEANPRFWGPSQLFVDSKMNFFEAFLYDYGFIKSPPEFRQDKKQTKYLWFGGLMSTIKNSLNLKFYNLKEDKFLDDLSNWLENDVYRRNDTIEVFKKELKNE